jgi:hypothetical protein
MQSMFPVRATAGGASAAPSAMSPASTQAYGQPTLTAANSNAATPAAGNAYPYGAATAATSAYGQTTPYQGKNLPSSQSASPAAAYGAGYANGAPAYGSAPYGSSGSAYPSAYPSSAGAAAGGGGQAGGYSGSPSSVGKTTAYGMPALNAWQPSTLPVSPWSTISPGGVAPLGGGVDTTTILRADLKALKRSRLKGWGYLFLSVGIFVGLGYFGVKQHLDIRKQLNTAKQQLGDAKKGYEAALTRLGVSESAAAAATSNAPGAVVTPPVAAVAATSPATAKLGDDLKKQLAPIAGLSVDTRGDRVVISMDPGALFEGNQLEPSMSGYRVLYKLSKMLKPVVKDRRVVITVPGDAKRGKTWNVAAARAVSLGRYAIDDVGVDAHRVTSSAPGAPQGRGGRHIEFALEAMPETTKS